MDRSRHHLGESPGARVRRRQARRTDGLAVYGFAYWKPSATAVGENRGADPLPQLTDEAIAEATAKRQYIYAKPVGASVKLYTMNGALGMTGTATGIALVASSKSV